MRQNVKIGMGLLLAALCAGCGQKVDHRGKTPLVEVGRTYLYKEDVLSALPAGLKGKDSLAFVEKYIRNWVEDVLLYEKAEGNIPDNLKLEERVASYRRSLILHAYQEELVNQKLGNEVTDTEVEQYYTAHPDLFHAEQPYVKGLFLKAPLNARQLSQARVWYRKNTEEALDQLEKFSISGTVAFDYFYDRWVPVSELSAKIPLKALETEVGYLQRNHNVEVKDTAYCYLLHVEHFLAKGEQLPIEYAKSEIKNILVNLKRVDFLRKVKEDLYREASEENDIIYY